MKFYKQILFSLTTFATLLPLSLSAVTFKELDKKIRTTRACLAPIELIITPYK